jgi:tetratricopeptide (TPR) repeat protein
MSGEPQKKNASHGRAALLRMAGLAAALGVAAWFIAPRVLPVGLPPDFPSPPDLSQLNASTRELIRQADEKARQRPGSADAAGKLGMAYHANLLYEQAEAAYGIAARLAPRDPQWTYALAVLHEENGRDSEQLNFLARTIELKPAHVPALIKLADSSFKSDRLDEAARHYESASKAAEGTATLQAAFGLTRIAARRGGWKKVIETAAPAADAYPHAAPLHALLEQAYTALGETGKAGQARQSAGWAKAKAVPPLEDPFIEQLMGVCYSSTRLLKHAGLLSRTGHPGRAIEVARRAVAAEPTDADVRNYLARTLISFFGGQPEAIEEAMDHLDECLRLRPSDPVPLGGFADDFFKSPKPPAAVERLRALLRARPDIPGVHFFLGEAADALGESAEAAAEYRAALKSNPNDSAAYNKLGLIAERAGRYAEASAHFHRAIQLNPLNTAARLNLAIERIQRGDYQQGFRQLDEILRINPHDAAAHFCMGFAYLSMKRPTDAAAKFNEGLHYKPEDAEARFGLGAALATLGRRDEAVAELRQALKLRPNHSPARELLYQLGY